MRIAMVSEHASPLAALGGVDAGGQNLHVAELSAALARRGHDVTVYTRRDDPGLPERTRTKQGYQVVHVTAGPEKVIAKDEMLPYMGQFANVLQQHWRRERPDLVHAHFWMSGLASLLAGNSLDIPVVQTFHALGTVKKRHQGTADTSPPERLGIERMIGRRAAGIVATCSDEVFELIRMGVPRQSVSVVPCGVDPSQFSPNGPVANRHGRRIVSVGRLVERKGFRTIIAALPRLPDTELVIAGGPARRKLADDPEARRLMRFAAAHGVADRVELAGEVSRARMPALLRSADVVVCVPHYEPFGIVPLEAMACGKPVVASAVGGLVDTVVDGVTGLLVPPRAPVPLADAIRCLTEDEVRGLSFGIAGRDRILARYTWDRVALGTVAAYERVTADTTSGMLEEMS
ncbi:glycosyltransferase [Actinocrispum sp. NPDC049592]|uniref:glycosyltransferase n=1 Tax=Actinocrispum sp. NPDC049592 TaxID=3154835 RepID=UPI003413508E